MNDNPFNIAFGKIPEFFVVPLLNKEGYYIGIIKRKEVLLYLNEQRQLYNDVKEAVDAPTSSFEKKPPWK